MSHPSGGLRKNMDQGKCVEPQVSYSIFNKSQAMKRAFILLAIVFTAAFSWAQETPKKVLFVGNSYTYVNNLPSLIQQMSESTGCRMEFEQVTPGGATFNQHCNSSGAMESIGRGGWDAVVLQEQSQLPSFSWSQFSAESLPFACQLAEAAYARNDCAEVIFYMTWGRKNGDAGNADEFDSLATYEGMDDLLCERYTYMAQINNASVSPVGRVWRKLRTEHPDIELYQSDESHPSLAGSYAAACSFYTILFHNDPTLVTADLGLDAETAQTIRLAAKSVVFDSLWKFSCHAFGTVEETGDVMSRRFKCLSAVEPELCLWEFGDGESATELNPSHTYITSGVYAVRLIAGKRCHPDTTVWRIAIGSDGPMGIVSAKEVELKLDIYPNPATDYIVLKSAKPTEIKIIDILGRTRKSFKAESCMTISVSELDEGVYTVVQTGVNGKESKCAKLVIKQR